MNGPIILHLLEERRKNNYIGIRRALRDELEIFNIPEARFQELFRFNQTNVMAILNAIRGNLHVPKTRTGIPVEIKVLVALRFFATGSYQRGVGQDFNLSVSQATASRAIKEVGLAIEEILLPIWVKFPSTAEEKTQIKRKCMFKFHFPGVIGCIDGTHVKIMQPEEEGHNYYNRKGFYSKNVQIICDFDLKIININGRHAGSSHDAFIWRQSAVRHHLEEAFGNGENSSWFLGDSGYPLEPWLMTPVLGAAANTPADRYNHAHSSARNTIERVIGLLKNRFRALNNENTLRYTPRMAGIIVNACAVLHNMYMHYHPRGYDYLEQDDIRLEYDADDNEDNNDLNNVATNVRNRIINSNFL